jgi:HlyD family secretion protein
MNAQTLPTTGSPPEASRIAFDQLDTLVRVTTIQGWVYLATLLAVSAAAVIFAVVYMVPTKVGGEGILLTENDRLCQVRSQAAGRLVALHVEVGDEVWPELVIGEVAQEDLSDTITQGEANLKELQREDAELSAFEQTEKRTQETAMAAVQHATRLAQKDSRDKLRLADRLVNSSDRLRAKQHMNDLDLLTAREKLYEISRDITSGDTRLAELELKRVEAETVRKRAALERRQKVAQLQTKLCLDRDKLQRTSHVVSKARGRVADILTPTGELVREGSAVVLLHSPKEDTGAGHPGAAYDAIVFVPAGEGKKIELGNDVEVTPATVKREEHGFLCGRVVSISELPATKLAMEAALAHPELVDSFLKRHAPGVLLRVHVKLDEDDGAAFAPAREPGTARNNHFKWSSTSGPRQPLKTGTMCQAAIVVARKPLIGLLLPWFRTQTGAY